MGTMGVFRKLQELLMTSLFLFSCKTYEMAQIVTNTKLSCLKNKLGSARRFRANSLFHMQIVEFDATFPV
jgi:hypothetical protein